MHYFKSIIFPCKNTVLPQTNLSVYFKDSCLQNFYPTSILNRSSNLQLYLHLRMKSSQGYYLQPAFAGIPYQEVPINAEWAWISQPCPLHTAFFKIKPVGHDTMLCWPYRVPQHEGLATVQSSTSWITSSLRKPSRPQHAPSLPDSERTTGDQLESLLFGTRNTANHYNYLLYD